MLIREFKENDRPALRSIYLQSRIVNFTWLDAGKFKPGDFDKAIEGEQVLVAEEDGHIAGFASAWLPESFIHLLFINPAYAKKGVGKKLLDACVFCLEQPVRLKCMDQNLKALSFYQSQGWRIEETGEDECGGYLQLINQ